LATEGKNKDVMDKLGRLETSAFINHNSVVLLLNQEE
jgi:hypothetical protein